MSETTLDFSDEAEKLYLFNVMAGLVPATHKRGSSKGARGRRYWSLARSVSMGGRDKPDHDDPGGKG